FVEAFQRTGVVVAEEQEGELAAGAAERAVDQTYKIVFGNEGFSIGEPFVTSFCGIPNDKYAYTNGLLNMWQGYGAGGGYALRFDTRTIHDLASHYFAMHACYASFGPVT